MKNVFKILGLLTLLALIVVSCKKKEEHQQTTPVEDGFYVSGKAIYTEELKQATLMEAGWIDKFPNPSEKREGLMVKFLYVKAGTDGFFLKQQAGSTLKTYGLDGAWTADTTGKKDWAWKGKLKENGSVFTAPAGEGLYFFIVDIPTMKVAILKVKSWEVVGNMTGWGFDSNFVFTQKSLALGTGEWEFSNLELKPGKEFKVRFDAYWNYQLDTTFGNVQMNIGMGADLTKLQYGGANYAVSSAGDATHIPSGIYKLALKWDFANGISLTWTKTGDVSYTNWTNTQIEIVGNGVAADNPNAVSDNIWNWNVYLFADNNGLPTKNGNVYTWTWTNVHILANQGWKVRSHDATNSFDAGNNIVDPNNAANWVTGTGNSDINLSVEGQYDLTLVIDAENGDSKTLQIRTHTSKK